MTRFSALLATAALILALPACGGGDADADAPPAGDMPMEGMEGMEGRMGDMSAMQGRAIAPPEGAMVHITSPGDGDTISGPDVTVTLETMSIPLAIAGELQEGTGHHHLFLDTEVTPTGEPIPTGIDGVIHLGQMQTEHTFVGLTPGEYRVIAVMADGLHFPFDPPVADTVTFVVSGG